MDQYQPLSTLENLPDTSEPSTITATFKKTVVPALKSLHDTLQVFPKKKKEDEAELVLQDANDVEGLTTNQQVATNENKKWQRRACWGMFATSIVIFVVELIFRLLLLDKLRYAFLKELAYKLLAINISTGILLAITFIFLLLDDRVKINATIICIAVTYAVQIFEFMSWEKSNLSFTVCWNILSNK